MNGLRQMSQRIEHSSLFKAPDLLDKNATDERVIYLANLFSSDPARLWTAGEMTKTVNLSISQLNKLFKKYTNLSPTQYLRKVRFEEAAKLLSETFLTVKEIRFKTGLVDKSRFNKVFKEIYGMTPVEYRKKFASRKREFEKAYEKMAH